MSEPRGRFALRRKQNTALERRGVVPSKLAPGSGSFVGCAHTRATRPVTAASGQAKRSRRFKSRDPQAQEAVIAASRLADHRELCFSTASCGARGAQQALPLPAVRPTSSPLPRNGGCTSRSQPLSSALHDLPQPQGHTRVSTSSPYLHNESLAVSLTTYLIPQRHLKMCMS